MQETTSRRRYLTALGTIGVAGLAGCSSGDSGGQATQTATSNLGGANFTFEYDATDRQVTVQFNGGARVLAGELEVRSTAGPEVTWAELGSTVSGPDDAIETGATARLAADIINWERAVGPTETIRLVHVGQETPSTLGRFTPPESSTLTATVPTETPTSEPPETPTAEPTETPSDTPTPPADTTPPSITAFSIANPSGQEIRISFDSDERLAAVDASLSGAASATLSLSDFTQTGPGDGTYTYEATYAGSSDGSYTATLNEAADSSGNDGASGQSVTISVTTTAAGTTVDGFEDGDTSAWSSTGDAPSTFEASQDRAYDGSWSAEFLEGSSGDGTAEWSATGETVQPTRVETAHALEDGQIYADTNTEWRLGETTVLRVNYNWSNNFCAVNGTGADADENSGAVVADLPWPSSDGFFHIVLDDIDWDANEVGEIRVNGTVEAESVPFFEDADGIDRTAVSIGGNGDNEVFIDDTTIPEPTGTEPETPATETTIDGFEDGDTSGWTSTGDAPSTFEASQDRAYDGSWSAEFLEGSSGDGTAEWSATGETVQPTTVETAHALEDGQIYADTNTEWRLGETTVLRINYNWSNNFCAVNGTGADASENSGAVVADLPWPSSDGFFHVVLDDIDWDANEVGEIRVNGTVEAESVPFFEDADGIDRTAVSIGGNGDNEVFIDDTTIP